MATLPRSIDKIDGVDVIDDYQTEKKECEINGDHMNKNIYLTKAILGPKYCFRGIGAGAWWFILHPWTVG